MHFPGNKGEAGIFFPLPEFGGGGSERLISRPAAEEERTPHKRLPNFPAKGGTRFPPAKKKKKEVEIRRFKILRAVFSSALEREARQSQNMERQTERGGETTRENGEDEYSRFP